MSLEANSGSCEITTNGAPQTGSYVGRNNHGLQDFTFVGTTERFANPPGQNFSPATRQRRANKKDIPHSCDGPFQVRHLPDRFIGGVNGLLDPFRTGLTS